MDNTEQFQAGDTVVLTTDSTPQDMVVIDAKRDQVTCGWFFGHRFHSLIFPASALVRSSAGASRDSAGREGGSMSFFQFSRPVTH